MSAADPWQCAPRALERPRPNLARLRIGIDGESLRAPLSGVGRYVYSLCCELEELLPNALFFAYSRLPAARLTLPSQRWTLRTERLRPLRHLPSFVWLKTRGAALCVRDELDVFWASRTLHPHLRGVRTVCTVHDLNHLVVPETMQAATLWSHRIWFERDVKAAEQVVANSRGTAERLQMLLRRPILDVIAPGLDPSFRPPSPAEQEIAIHSLAARGITRPYLLSVATTEPRKNIEALVEAFVKLKRENQLQGYSLILVGQSGWKQSAFDHALAEARPYGVIATGYVPQALLPVLYANAEAFVFPSLYEGFGMPVLEARACGARVLISNCRELCDVGGESAVVVEPHMNGIRAGILRVLAAPRVPEDALAVDYSWQRAAVKLAAIFSDNSGKDRVV